MLRHAAARAGCRAHHELIGFSIGSGGQLFPAPREQRGWTQEPQHSGALPAAEGLINPCLYKPIDLGWHGIHKPSHVALLEHSHRPCTPTVAPSSPQSAPD